MFRNKRRASLHRILLTSFFYLILITMCLLAVFAIRITLSRIQVSTQNLLNYSLIIAKQEYNSFFEREGSYLTALASMADPATFTADLNKSKVVQRMQNTQDHDFWVIAGSNGRVLATDLDTRQELPPELLKFVDKVLADGKEISASELFQISNTAAFPASLQRQAVVEIRNNGDGKPDHFPYVLVQLVGVPVKDAAGATTDCLIGAKIVNNDLTIPNSYSQLVPNSFLSIGVEGIRISANIKGTLPTDFVGMRQPDPLVTATMEGKRYLGSELMEPNDIHLVASDPLYVDGNPVGAISTGLPSYGVATVKRDTLISICFALLICLGIAFTGASYMAGRITNPITGLSRLADEISHQETITEAHINRLNHSERSNIVEIDQLNNCFQNMTTTLYRKCTEADNYLDELEQDRLKLSFFAEQLLEANSDLEKRVEERTSALQKAIDELKTLNHLKTQFLANMSHELRTPLHSIIGFSEMLYDELYGDLNNVQKDYVSIVINSSRHLLQIISDILDISSIERDKIALYKQDLPLPELIASVVTIMKPQAEEHGVDLTTRVPQDLPIISVDAVRIKQVLSNLLSNAIKFTPAGGRITVEAFRRDGEVGVTVADTGIGIKKEHQKKVFDEFYQCEDTYKRRFEGVGLGLPLSKKLVELHQGRIELESTPGEGTRISFFLPVSA